MKTILYIIQKEFLQIFRNKTMLPLIFMAPIIQLLILVFAATMELKEVKMSIVDNDLSTSSRELYHKYSSSPFYDIVYHGFSTEEAMEGLKRNNTDVILVIPSGFEDNMYRESQTEVQFLINAINTSKANLIYAYTSAILLDYNNKIIPKETRSKAVAGIEISERYWFNERLNYKYYMLPGVLVILVTIISMFLTAINIVREKELGNIEQINVSPIKKHQFIIGKLIPFWLIALLELAFGLGIGWVFFDVPIVGSLWVLFSFTAVYLIVVIGLGLLMSTISNTQQQVMFIAFFFMITFLLMSGIFTPTESMPKWAQYVDQVNPMYYMMKNVRMILLKGSGFADVAKDMLILGVYGFGIMALAVFNYRKRA